MRLIFRFFVRLLSSFGLSIALVCLLALLTWLGTLEQVHTGLYEVQKKYFESFVLIHHAGPIPIPLPGANLVLCVLFVNLLVGGIVRLRRNTATAGILVVHLGIALLLVSGFVKTYFSSEGHVTLYEGQQANHFQSYYRWELALIEPLDGTRVREHIVRQQDFEDASGAKPVTLSASGLPFDLEVHHFTPNCQPLPKGPMFESPTPTIDGFFLSPEKVLPEAEANIAGLYVAAIDRQSGERQTGILWGAEKYPLTVHAAGKDWAIELRKQRFPLSFTLALEKFTKEDHPGTGMPKSFESDVTVSEAGGARALCISMNEPLRNDGYVVYQASWGPSNARAGERLFSTFAVVRNPADRFPLGACIVIAVGLLFHFTRKLARSLRMQARPA
jgi:hypothetical protein